MYCYSSHAPPLNTPSPSTLRPPPPTPRSPPRTARQSRVDVASHSRHQVTLGIILRYIITPFRDAANTRLRQYCLLEFSGHFPQRPISHATPSATRIFSPNISPRHVIRHQHRRQNHRRAITKIGIHNTEYHYQEWMKEYHVISE
jgi:hypothetical protein